MSLDDFAKTQAERKQGFPGVMDRISPEHRQEAIDGYAKGYSGPTILRVAAAVLEDGLIEANLYEPDEDDDEETAD